MPITYSGVGAAGERVAIGPSSLGTPGRAGAERGRKVPFLVDHQKIDPTPPPRIFGIKVILRGVPGEKKLC